MTQIAENAKIAEAMKGRAAARKQSPRERITSQPVTRAALDAADADRAAAVLAEMSEPLKEETVTTFTPAPKPAPKGKKTPAKRPVLTDEQKAERDRLGHVFILAKWARERAEKAQARVNADKGMSPEDRKAAKALVIERLTAEATARKAWDASKKAR